MKPLVRYVCESAPKSFFWICTMIWVRTMIGMLKKSHCQFANRPFLSSPEPLYQNEVKCSAFDMQMTFHSHANKTHFHKKGWAFGLILKGRVLGTRKWPIRMKGNSKSISGNSLSPLGAQNKDLALLRQRYPLGLDYVCEAQAKEFKAISSLTECAPLLHNSIGCNSNLIPTIRSKGNDAYSVVTQATRRKKPRNRFDQHTLTGPFTKAETTLLHLNVLQTTCSQLACSSIYRALHRYRRGQGFESRTSLNFFRLSFRNCKSCVYNCDDLLSYNTSTNSQTTTPKLSTVRDKIWWAWPPCEWQEHHHCHGTLYMCLGNGVNQSFTKLHSGESDEAIK